MSLFFRYFIKFLLNYNNFFIVICLIGFGAGQSAEKRCRTACPEIYDPVCGSFTQFVPPDMYKTFSNDCERIAYNCVHGTSNLS